MVSFTQQPAWNSWDICGGGKQIKVSASRGCRYGTSVPLLCCEGPAAPRHSELSCAGAREQPNINTIKLPPFRGTNAPADEGSDKK